MVDPALRTISYDATNMREYPQQHLQMFVDQLNEAVAIASLIEMASGGGGLPPELVMAGAGDTAAGRAATAVMPDAPAWLAENGDDGGSSWSKARSDYWKDRGQTAAEGEFSPENLERMADGKPPLHDELGVPKELHHVVPQREGGSHDPSNLEEVWPWEHDAIDPYRHYRGPTPSGWNE